MCGVCFSFFLFRTSYKNTSTILTKLFFIVHTFKLIVEIFLFVHVHVCIIVCEL